MTWSMLDIAVVAVFATQLLGWCFVAAVIWKIKKGPVTRLQTRVAPLAESGKQLTARGADIAVRLKARALLLTTRSKTIRQRLRLTEAPEGMWIKPRHLKQAVGMVSVLRQRSAQKAGKAVKKRVSIAQRLGLLPPVLVRLAPLGKLTQVALQTLRQLRR